MTCRPVLVGEADVALHLVLDDGLALARRLQPDDRLAALGVRRLGLVPQSSRQRPS